VLGLCAALGWPFAAGCTETGISASGDPPTSSAATSGAAADGGAGCDPPEWPPSDGGCMAPPGADAGLVEGASCNPVTAEPCAIEAGATCGDEVDLQGHVVGFRCYDGPNEVPLCAPCDYDQQAFCIPGATCVAGKCLRYCCALEDCGGAACVKASKTGTPLFQGAPNLGVCSSH
jgi:hypothetical protein